MAFETDWGLSTVLEALRVARTARSPVTEGCRATYGPRNEALRDSGTPTVGFRWWVPFGVGKFEIRNSKFEIFLKPSMRE